MSKVPERCSQNKLKVFSSKLTVHAQPVFLQATKQRAGTGFLGAFSEIFKFSIAREIAEDMRLITVKKTLEELRCLMRESVASSECWGL